MTQQPQVLIIGGGAAGMAAAHTLAQFGIGVHLVERQAGLGGHAFQWACMATDQCRYCGACLSAELADQVLHQKGITVHLNAAVSGLQKKGDLFQADIAGPASDSIAVDAVLLAAGFEPFNPVRIAELGYGVYDRVITTADLNARFKQESLDAILPDTAAPAVAFIQCVGSRNKILGRDYCSQACCKTAVRQAEKILHAKPAARLTIFHMDLQVIGKVFRTQAAKLAAKVALQQGVAAKILNHLEPGKLSILYEDGRSGARTAAHFDLIVLAVGMDPAAGLGDLADQLGIQRNAWGFIDMDAANAPAGVYAAGSAAGPLDIVGARDQGVAAAHQIARDLNFFLPAHDRQLVAVLGGTVEARELAASLAGDRHLVLMLDPSQGPAPELPGVEYHGGVSLDRVAGTIGHFQLTFSAQGQTRRAQAAAIAVAVGADAAADQAAYGVGQRLADFSREFAADPTAAAQPVVFWLDRRGPEWKTQSRRCLELALDLRHQGKSVIVIMEKMLVHGMNGQRQYDQARHAGVRFLRVRDAAGVAVTVTGKGVHLEFEEATLPGTPVGVDCRRLVLPDQIRPSALTARIAEILGQEVDAEGFLQSPNVRHRPTSSPRRGIFFVGACHDETDSTDIAAEVRSISACLDLLLRSDRNLDDPARIEEKECVRCLTCLRICPHGAVVLRDGFQPRIDPAACFGCGVCTAHCPARAIKPAAAEATAAPAAGRIVVFACRRSGFLAAQAAALLNAGPDVTVISVPCAGRLDQAALLQPLLEGAEKVIVAACHDGNCRSVTGSRTAGVLARQAAAAIPAMHQAVSHFGIAANEPQKIRRMISEAGLQEEKFHA